MTRSTEAQTAIAEPRRINASLMSWPAAPPLLAAAANAAEPSVAAILERFARSSREQLVADCGRILGSGPDRGHRFHFSWKVVSHCGVTVRASVEWDDREPNTVVARVESHTVATWSGLPGSPIPEQWVEALAERLAFEIDVLVQRRGQAA